MGLNSPWGSRGELCKNFGWTYDYLLWGISWLNVQLMVADAARIKDLDTDNNGVIDTETITTAWVGYSPSKEPEVSIVVVSPDIGIPDESYRSDVTKRISSQLINKYFSMYD